MPSLREIYLIQIAVVLSCAGILFFVDKELLTGFLAGAAVMTINFALLAWLWHRIFSKKPIATTIGLVVIKYAVLGAFLYVFVSQMRVDIIPFFAGISTIGGSVVIATIHGAYTSR